MLDFNSKSMLSDRINFFIDEQIDAVAAQEPPREYLGASVIGHQCERHVQYHLLAARGQVERKKFPSRIMRIFDRGHTYEAKVRNWLKGAGFMFGFGAQGLGFQDFGGVFRGHVDGVLTAWRRRDVGAPIELPALWENKALGAKNWKKVSTDKLKNYSSTYYAQVQIYMSYLKLERCLFTAINADTMEIYHELVPYDALEADLCYARVGTVIRAADAGQLVQRCTMDRNFYICKWCDFSADCWRSA